MSEQCNKTSTKVEDISDEDEQPKNISPSAETIQNKDIPHETNINDSEYLIYHNPKYTLPFYRDPKITPLSLRDQVKVICSYHALISKSISNQAKIQIDSCSYPDPIEAVQKKNVFSALKRENEESKEAEGSGNKPDEYVSRAGRITKRKFYSEVEERKKDSIVSPSSNGEDEEIPSKRKAPATPSRNRNLRQKQSNKTDSIDSDTENKKKGNTKTSSPSTTPKQKKGSDGFVEPVVPGSNKRSTRKNIECPICGNFFPEKEVEQHASSCGDFVMGNTSNSEVERLRCQSCRKVLMSGEDYGMHCSACRGGPSYLN